ncbi:MAG: hypothetical protein ACXWVD_00135 [Telluria sp.]
MSETSGYPFDAARLDFAAGGWSMNALATKHGIPEATLRRHAKKHGWVKGAADVKREMVREALAGGAIDEALTNDLTNDEAVRQRRLDEATQDVRDMETGLQVARACMNKLLVLVDNVDNPNDIKRIVEANKGAVETIRKIRSLDNDDTPAEVTVNVDDGFAELRAAFRARLAAMDAAGSDAGPA